MTIKDMHLNPVVPLPIICQLKTILTHIVEANGAMAVWRLPHQSIIMVLIDFSTQPEKINLMQSHQVSGFVINYFCDTGSQSHLLKPDLLLALTAEGWQVKQQSGCKKASVFLNKLKQIKPVNSTWHSATSHASADSQDKSHYLNLVNHSIQQIKHKVFHKVVLARQKTLSTTTHPVDLFASCLILYPSAMVSLISVAGVGTWVGASPEKLLSQTKNGTIETIALAGTQSLNKQRQVIWSDKEKKEHAWVAQFIRDCCQQLGLNNVIEQKMKTITAYDMVHLQTKFTLKPQTPHRKNIAFSLLNQLHPTPAVCGIQQARTQAYIIANEGFERQLYAGYLGAVNLCGETHVFVNLRCVQFFNQSVLLYAGAGITDASIAENEWQETEIKMQNMMRLLTCL